MRRSWMPVTTLAMLLHQTMNTHVMNTLQCYTVLNGSIWILFLPCNMLYHRPQGSSTPGKAVLWSQVNVLETYNAADRQYTLSEHTAAAYGADWLYLDTLSTMEDAVPWTTKLFDTWKTTNGSQHSGYFYHAQYGSHNSVNALLKSVTVVSPIKHFPLKE